ncbi:MAG: DNA-directed RNA polymerase subunit beta [Candidatus Vogelbacteria bacterium CG10_big_fil_rev_8_21_14_0_10_49_38]|uniref:DNA-directed RNA polymerase subunit beta n=1 Tax=Candidatus Vogelbacteria bacterium CG10_big_fil_rev_8_21_14_0_10_49_38 TaxID=1975043 RepID=A0A2H0RHW7_9BACT|nr:MAG: DNA-directed RNA polymerase subunit beta [bacterium CG10_49_38]PIR46057.1 MAG: DNA-directed RNA polymerase subunit beta [Candidatus Vogelbacteria bacterium CG10_big_fil_rev_8_21_14_0_10_49_38]
MKKKYFSRYKKPLVAVPDLVEVQKQSYDWLIKTGLKELFKEYSPIRDYSEKKFELEFAGFQLDEPKYDEYYARENNLSYDAPLRLRVKLINKLFNQEKEQEIFLADFPLMTSHGTFIINGIERVIVPQLARSFGIFFTANEIKGRKFFGAKIIPARGAWIELETEIDDAIYVRIDRRRKFPITSLLRVFADRAGLDSSDEALLKVFEAVKVDLSYIQKSLAKDYTKTVSESYVEIYKRLRDSDLATPANSKEFVSGLFEREKYDLSAVGRVRFNQRFEVAVSANQEENDRRTLSFDDLVKIVSQIIVLNTTKGAKEDDIDHLGFRRVRCVGEMLQAKLKVGMMQMKRNIQDRMSTVDAQTLLPVQIISPRPWQARLKEFFSTNQLSQFMNQDNILAELEHLRTLSALGPGGLTRERAGLEVRDVHSSHYGKVCPIHTPEGPNIGLIVHLASYARVNSYGIIEAPYRRVTKGRITDEIVYLNALEEEKHVVAHAGVSYNDEGRLLDEQVEARRRASPGLVAREEVEFIDVAPNQAYSVATSMIPFLEHDDANRALMGSNMQKQAVPCVRAELPLVATGIEEKAAHDSGRVILAAAAGVVKKVDGRQVVIKRDDDQEDVYALANFKMTNDYTCFHHRPAVALGDKVKKGSVLADSSSTVEGELSLGQNVFVAFMPFGGANYEDAIILSERLVKESKFTSIYIEEFEANVRDTKLGPEITTHDIPNIGEIKLKNLDEDGVVRVGAEVGPNDILVGKITPKGETELTPEERLLRAIFGEKARDVKDTSLRMPHGRKGRIIGIKIFSRDQGDRLESGIIKKIKVQVAQWRNVEAGDKLAGRHGNKGVISKILPEEDMPYLADGRPVDVILTPLGVPSRMNLGQIFEMHLGLAAGSLGYQAITPVFAGVTEKEIKAELKEAGWSDDGKVELFDGRTGDKFGQRIAVGQMYMLKLNHMVEDKIHMRSIGPYSLITQQPLGGRSQGGGQRFGEMEVWALEGYGAAHMLREMLTIKSDDIVGRSSAFDSLVKGEPVRPPNIPASFNVMLNELRGLAMDIELRRFD